MSIIYCPECGHEVSHAAVACPNCGRPLQAPPTIEKKVVVADRVEEGGFPPWAFIPLGLLALGLVFLIFYGLSGNKEDANTNVNVSMTAAQRAARDRDLDRTTSETHTTSVPGESTTVTAPASAPDMPTQSQSVTVPGSQTAVQSTTGRVVIDAKVTTKNGQPVAVKNEKFYLLDKDLESILMDARLDPIEGNSMSNSFGLSVLYPDRYGDFNRKALAAIKEHIKYAGTTDGSGKAQLGGVTPNSYYLFGITKTGRGFALWSNSVNVQTGDNIMNLQPQPVNEMMSNG